MNATAPCFVSPAGSEVHAARDFTRRLTELLRNEQGAMVSFLLALAECDGRRLWASLGYASLFDYLHRELGMSKAAAFYRKTAIGLVQRYPTIVEALGDGRLCITSLAEVAKVITPENAAEILPRFFHRSSREAKEIALAIAPMTAPPKRDVLSVVQPKRQGVEAAVLDSSPAVQALELERPPLLAKPVYTHPDSTGPAAAAPVHRAGDVQPLTAELRRLHVTVSKRWVEKLEAAKAALSHSIPSGSVEEVLEAALDALLEREAKRMGLLEKKPRRPGSSSAAGSSPESSSAASRAWVGRERGAGPHHEPSPHRKAIPADVRREVLLRDQGRCQAKIHDGSLCGSRTRVQLDHIVPVALGGPSNVENLRVLCERHNQLAARAVFGERVVDLFAGR